MTAPRCGFSGFLLVALLLLGFSAATRAGTGPAASRISRSAADRCASKLKILQNFATQRSAERKQTTRFSEEEINSYLALDLQSKYHPSLRSLILSFEEERLQGVAVIDFDRLGMASTKLLPRLLGFVFSGVHTLTARGQLLSGNGKGSFRLEQARFDSTTLPKMLVEEIISAVGRKQNPPFDPMKPSELFYDIEKVEVHTGYIVVYQ